MMIINIKHSRQISTFLIKITNFWKLVLVFFISEHLIFKHRNPYVFQVGVNILFTFLNSFQNYLIYFRLVESLKNYCLNKREKKNFFWKKEKGNENLCMVKSRMSWNFIGKFIFFMFVSFFIQKSTVWVFIIYWGISREMDERCLLYISKDS